MKRRSATIQAFGAFALYASAVAADGAAPPAPETRPDILASWQQEWTHLERRIADRRATGGRLRTVPVDQVVSRQALIETRHECGPFGSRPWRGLGQGREPPTQK
jgi:hypothetical protein